MNWIQGIQREIDYVEENITEEIDFEEAAKRVYSSSFHFQRVFSILCGFPHGDYIRMRRLSLAGEELAKGSVKIIDAALKYGYDTPESFSRGVRSMNMPKTLNLRCIPLPMFPTRITSVKSGLRFKKTE